MVLGEPGYEWGVDRTEMGSQWDSSINPDGIDVPVSERKSSERSTAREDALSPAGCPDCRMLRSTVRALFDYIDHQRGPHRRATRSQFSEGTDR